MYIKYIGFGLVGFYGIPTIVGYLMPNPFIHIYKYMIFKHILLMTFLTEVAYGQMVSSTYIQYKQLHQLLIVCLYAIKCFPVLLFNTDKSIKL